MALEEIGDSKLEGQMTNVKKSVGVASGMILIVVVASVLIAIAAGIWIIRTIRLPLQQAVELATAVSEGDLSYEIETVRNDEIGSLISALDQFVWGRRATLNTESVNWNEVATFFGEIRQQLDRVVAIEDGSPSAILMADKNLTIQYVNQATKLLMGKLPGGFTLSSSQLVGQSLAYIRF